ncbi:MAG: hypothetical protein AB1847_06540 [bacterium]
MTSYCTYFKHKYIIFIILIFVIVAISLTNRREALFAADFDPPYEHTEVYAWYFGTIDTDALSIGALPPVFIDDNGKWYFDRAHEGFCYATIGGGFLARPSDGGFRVNPLYSCEEIYNGNFEVGVSALNHICWAGWSYHGGSGARTWIFQDNNHFVRLTGVDDALVHNRLFVNPGITHLSFDMRVTLGTVGLHVSFVDRDNEEIILVNRNVDAVNWIHLSEQLPSEVLGKTFRLRFTIISVSMGGSTLDLDNICFQTNRGSARRIPDQSVSTYSTTVITHGYTTMEPLGQQAVYADWMIPMAEGIRERSSGAGTVLEYIPATGQWESVDPIVTPGDIILIFNWQQESDILNAGGTKGFAEAAADALYAALCDPQVPAALEGSNFLANNLHFIGHSRGAVVNSEVVERIVSAGYVVDHVTTLDPHPVNGTLPPLMFDFEDAEPRTWQGVTWADNYWREDGTQIDYNGMIINGAYNVDLGPRIEEKDRGKGYRTGR